MEYTGERVVKERDKNTLYYVFFEHFYRYCLARGYCRNKLVLDAGCGTGYGTYELSKFAKKVTGIDISEQAIDFCKNNYAQPNIEFLTMDFRTMDFKTSSFDCVVSFEILEHIVEQEKFLEEVKRVLKPGGKLIISTPDKENYRKGFAKGDYNRFHKRELSRHEFEHLLRSYFSIERLYGQVEVGKSKKNISTNGTAVKKSSFKNFVRRLVVKNTLLYKLFVVMTLKRIRYAVRPLDEYKQYTYLIAVCVNNLRHR